MTRPGPVPRGQTAVSVTHFTATADGERSLHRVLLELDGQDGARRLFATIQPPHTLGPARSGRSLHALRWHWRRISASILPQASEK